MKIRELKRDEIPQLAHVYSTAVRGQALKFYSVDQINSWAEYAEDLENFTKDLWQGYTLVLEIDGCIVSFAQLSPLKHLALLYTLPEHGEKGYAGKLLDAIELYARSEGQQDIQTEASLLSKTLFMKHGYSIESTETVSRGGASFFRYRMIKQLNSCCED